MKLSDRISRQLEQIEEQGLKRVLKRPTGIDLSSNDYLGLAADRRLKEAFTEAADREGVGSTASRLLRGERECFQRAERRFAEWKQTEAALYFATGYQANIGLLQTFAEKDDVIFSDELNHASLIDGIRLTGCRKIIFPHLDTGRLEEYLHKTECRGQKFLVTESLFSMDGDIAPLRKYAQICRRTNTNLIVDEAHAVGLYGARGSGLIEETGIGEDVFLSINTAGKALGAAGAFVAGSRLAIDYLINRCRSFIFSTAPLPAVAAALVKAIEIIEDEPERGAGLHRLSRYFNRLLGKNGISAPPDMTQIVPVIIGDSNRAMIVAGGLQQLGFDVRAVRPPTVAPGTSRLRVSLNVKLTKEMLDDFVQALVVLTGRKAQDAGKK